MKRKFGAIIITSLETIPNTTKDFHAEVNLKTSQNFSKNCYIGCSKLCSWDCHLALEPYYPHRGTHGVSEVDSGESTNNPKTSTLRTRLLSTDLSNEEDEILGKNLKLLKKMYGRENFSVFRVGREIFWYLESVLHSPSRKF